MRNFECLTLIKSREVGRICIVKEYLYSSERDRAEINEHGIKEKLPSLVSMKCHP